MSIKDYRKAYETAATELESLLAEQERIEGLILSLRKTMNILSTLIQQTEGNTNWRERAKGTLEKMVQSSLTDDILKIVGQSNSPMTTSDVRDELSKLGSLIDHKNPLATVNAVLNRLREQGKVKETLKDGRKAWQRIRPFFGAY